MPTPPLSPMKKRQRWASILVAVAAVLVAGLLAGLFSRSWGARPRAPALIDEPVYHNAREGFRFLVPEGWTVHSRGEAPPGRADKERLLVNYQRYGADKPAQFEVTLIDFPSTSDLAAHLAEPSYGAEKWRPKGAAETLPLKGIDATRYLFTARVGKEETTKEVVAVRRGERVYFFTALYATGDTSARDQMRRVVESTIWER
jgi:hypothetical protein